VTRIQDDGDRGLHRVLAGHAACRSGMVSSGPRVSSHDRRPDRYVDPSAPLASERWSGGSSSQVLTVRRLKMVDVSARVPSSAARPRRLGVTDVVRPQLEWSSRP